MNKYKVAETITNQLLSDLQARMASGTKLDVADESTKEEIADKWEDIIISELEKSEK